jgi:GAF domain-containing protein
MPDKKLGRYRRIQEQLLQLFLKQDDPISRMATVNALLYHKMDGFFWVGFYLLKGNRLLAGPYQGPLACMELAGDRGVCREAIRVGQPVVVPDVHLFPGHIACDSRSKSEIVIPLVDSNGYITGVLDIDSDRLNNFDETDTAELTMIVSMIYRSL